jgi:hypothetical protein
LAQDLDNDIQGALRILDQKIAETERNLAEAQRAMALAQRFPQLQAELNALRQTRALLSPPQEAPEIIPGLPGQADRVVQGSVAYWAIKVLREVGGQPLQLADLFNRIRMNKPDLNPQALNAVLSQCVARRLIQRMGPAMYALGPAAAGGVE